MATFLEMDIQCFNSYAPKGYMSFLQGYTCVKNHLSEFTGDNMKTYFIHEQEENINTLKSGAARIEISRKQGSSRFATPIRAA